LLRVLQEREVERLGESRSIPVDIRVIATTNASLATMVERGQFRADLYYRLNVIPLTIPPLRERQDDIALLAAHFNAKYAADSRLPLPQLQPDFIARLEAHSWPGNVRELGNFMRRVLTLSPTAELNSHTFDMESHDGAPPDGSPLMTAPAGTPICQVERLHLEKTLVLTNGNRTHAAEMLGISLRTLRNKIREYQLPPRRYA
jgi:DNA-binding NtrC family response regulator